MISGRRRRKSKSQIISETMASEKAYRLLLTYLDDNNKNHVLCDEPIVLNSNIYKNISYIIPIWGHIDVLKHNVKVAELCLSISEKRLPKADILLSRYLALQYNESESLYLANHYNLKGKKVFRHSLQSIS